MARPASAFRAAGLKWELMDKLSRLVHLDYAADAALHNHCVSILQTCESMYIHALALVAIHIGRVIGPHYFLIESDLLKRSPGVVKKDIAIG